MAENLQKLQASRAGYRAHLTQTIKKAANILTKEDSLTDSDITSIKRIIDQLTRKRSILEELDEKIVALVEEPKELEKEIFQSEDIKEEIDETIAQISSTIERFQSTKLSPSNPPSEVPQVVVENASDQTSSTSVNTNDQTHSGTPNEIAQQETVPPPTETQLQIETPVVTPVLPTTPPSTTPHHPSPLNQNSRLPKLNLPTFSGNPLQWFTFWDSFEATVHTNPTLGDVQKFSYLKAQLVGDASRAITGFPLTNHNYTKAVQLLKERFGDPTKVINAHMHCLLELPNPNYELASLQLFYDTMENHIRGLESLGKSHSNYGDLLVPIILGKLPQQVRTNLARDHDSHEWKFTQLRESIRKEIRILEAGAHSSLMQAKLPSPKHTTAGSFLTQTQGNQHYTTKHKPGNVIKRCAYCKGPHPTHNCNVVKDCQERWSIVKREKLCFNCLGNHKSSNCQSKFRCLKCKSKHHTTLCPQSTTPPPPPTFPPQPPPPLPTFPPQPSLPTPQNTQSNPQVPSSMANTQQSTSTHATLVPSTHSATVRHVSLLKTAIATVSTGQLTCDANILLDEGAQRSFITTDLTKQLGVLPTQTEEISLSAFGAQTPSRRHLPLTTVFIITRTGQRIPLEVLVVDEIATPLQIPLRQHITDMPHLKDLTLAHPITTQEDFRVSLLIGADHYWDIIEDKVIRGQGPTAVASKLGYLLSGPLPSPFRPPTTLVNLLQAIKSTKQTEFDLEKFWSLESIGITPPSHTENQGDFLGNYINTSITRNPNGSYTAKFPWKDDIPALPDNYLACERRTRAMIRRLTATPDLLKQYGDIIKEQNKRGFIEKVEENKPTDKTHYIPHHPIHKESTTTPVRVVFDCSFHSSPNSPSLNDCLLTGPPFLNDMCAILLRFRSFTYGLSADIEKAFLHVGLDESDRDFTRFLWLSDPTNPESKFDTFRFKTVLFGSTSSPFMLNATLRSHLENYDLPTAQNIRDNIYVDNIISGCDQETRSIQYYNEARSIMHDAHFNLHSWTTNSPSLQEIAVKDGTADPKPIVNILGLKWNPSTDTLAFPSTPGYTPPSTITKRHVLQISSKIYDPLGFLLPVTIKAKLFIQELWQNELEWDEPLPLELKNKWLNITKDLQEAINISIPRKYFPQTPFPTSTTYIHVFVDASPKAYGAVAYLTNENQSSLIMAKSRVAPMKELTLPQLELMAAVIGTRLANFLSCTLSSRYPNLKVKLWTDSEIVLHWLNNNKPLKQFIMHRIKEMKNQFPTSTWNHCKTDQNPADLLTRGITPSQLQSSSLWKKGPTWLLQESEWPLWNPSRIINLSLFEKETVEPTTITSSETNPEDTKSGIHIVIDTARYSSLAKLLSVTTYVYRFLQNIRKSRIAGPISTAERQTALKVWIKNCQTVHYSNEIANLTSPSSSHVRLPLVRQLRLFLDQDGFLRCGGRIHNAPLSELARFPYLLPKNDRLTELIVQDTHHKQLHSGINATVTALRQSYWITSIRQYVKKLLRHCVTCRKVTGTPFKTPDPAPLPKIRVEERPPFTVTGVDFAGPLYVRSQLGETKTYVCLFTCAVTRSVHLEIVTDLSEEKFLLAFRRFSSRKSLPFTMISDNASTYIASAQTLKELFESPSLKEAFSRQGVDWKFIPKRAPWYGGFWERLVGLTKTALKKTLGRASITLEELQTLIVEVEAILNDRPITFVSSDINDEEPLTPSHLLYGRRITSLPFDTPISADELSDPDYGSETNIRRRVKLQAILLQQFWKRWKHEYLTSLREFHRSSGDNKEIIRKGDVVLVHDDNLRSTWRLAVVEDLIRGGDELVRAASIRTSTGYTNRPICKLYPLELSTNEDEGKETTNHNDQENLVNYSTERERPVSKRPVRNSATKAVNRISEWTKILRRPPEDVEDM